MVIATITLTLSSRSQDTRRRFRRRGIAFGVSNEKTDMLALFEPYPFEAVAQPLDARLVGPAMVDHAHAFDASLSPGSERPRAGRKREERDDLPPPHEHLPRKREPVEALPLIGPSSQRQ